MVVCTICDEVIPKAKKCAHGKKPVNCGGACLTAHVEEHIATCQGKKVTDDKGKAIFSEEAFRVKSVQDGEDDSGKADDGFTATTNLKSTGGYQDETSSESRSSDETVEADPDADLAEVNSDAAQGILKMIGDLRHMPELTNCRNCYETKQELGTKKIRKCLSCALVGYCGKDCQRQHWDAVHKQECNILRGLAEVGLSKEKIEKRLRKLED